jgi:hypothetical protein
MVAVVSGPLAEGARRAAAVGTTPSHGRACLRGRPTCAQRPQNATPGLGQNHSRKPGGGGGVTATSLGRRQTATVPGVPSGIGAGGGGT